MFDSIIWLVGGVIWLVGSFLTAFLAAEKGHDFWTWLLIGLAAGVVGPFLPSMFPPKEQVVARAVAALKELERARRDGKISAQEFERVVAAAGLTELYRARKLLKSGRMTDREFERVAMSVGVKDLEKVRTLIKAGKRGLQEFDRLKRRYLR